MSFAMPWSKKSAYAVGALFSALIACSGEVHDHDNLRDSVLYCEEAVSALSECCPGFKERNTISCDYSYDYYPGGCDTSSRTYHKDPDLSIATSQCILGATCDRLRANGVCDALVSKPNSTGVVCK